MYFPVPWYSELPMPRRKTEPPPLTVPISATDSAAFERIRARLQGISRAQLARMLLHHGIWHAPRAVGGEIQAALDNEQPAGESPKTAGLG
jgi:hypothetical protein